MTTRFGRSSVEHYPQASVSTRAPNALHSRRSGATWDVSSPAYCDDFDEGVRPSARHSVAEFSPTEITVSCSIGQPFSDNCEVIMSFDLGHYGSASELGRLLRLCSLWVAGTRPGDYLLPSNRECLAADHSSNELPEGRLVSRNVRSKSDLPEVAWWSGRPHYRLVRAASVRWALATPRFIIQHKENAVPNLA